MSKAKILCSAVLVSLLCLLVPLNIKAQSPSSAALSPLTGPQKRNLLLIAREAIDATVEGRASREAMVEERLSQAQPLVVSIYVDGQLRGRAWNLRANSPLYLSARDLTYQAIENPKVSKQPLALDELARAKVSVAALGHYNRAKDDSEVYPGQAVLIFNGFTEWLALPEDVESKKAADLLSYACQQAGLRPRVWLLPETVIYTASVEESREMSSTERKM